MSIAVVLSSELPAARRCFLTPVAAQRCQDTARRQAVR
jgi:hypothetical protein